MICEEYREAILEFAIDAAGRKRIGDALAHVNSCRDCHTILVDFDRIVGSLGSAPAAPADRGVPVPDDGFLSALEYPFGGRHRVGWRASIGAIVAAILFIGAAFCVGKKFASLRQEGAGPASSVAKPVRLMSLMPAHPNFVMQPSDVAHDTTAFTKVSEVFEGRAGWMLISNSADTGSSRDLELLDRPVDTDHQLDVLRLTMLRENKVVSSVDLVIVPGQSADLTVMLPAGNSVYYHAGTSTGNDGRLNLLAEIRPAHVSGLAAEPGDRPGHVRPVPGFAAAELCTTLDLQWGRSISAGALQTASGRYELCGALCRSSVASHSRPQQIDANIHG